MIWFCQAVDTATSQCTSWASSEDVMALFLTAQDIQTAFGLGAAGVLSAWLAGYGIGCVLRLIRAA